MENENRKETEQELPEEEILTEEVQPAEPRPTWQRVAAWVALAAFLLVVAMFYVNMFRGG